MYAYPFVQMTRYKKKYYCVSATESTKEAIRGIIFFASFDFQVRGKKFHRVASANSQVAVSRGINRQD